MRLLVVEDDRVLQKIALRLLKSLGHDPDTASDGLEAVQMASAKRYDIVFMDLSMPRMDGVDAARQISQRPDTPSGLHRPPIIIALTSERVHGDFKRYQAAGFADWIAKPVQAESLKQAIEKWTANASGNTTPTAPIQGTPLGHAAVPAPRAEVDPTAAAVPPADLERIESLGDGGQEGMRQIVGLFFGQIVPKLEALKAAVEAGDRSEIRRLAHFCAGSSATCGMTALAAPLRELEDAALADEMSKAPLLLRQSQQALDATRTFLSAKLGQ
jgi:CheY-like chemotaxis protein/HPt (histidine-containing phosphotransfer) domain-containing protein